MAVLLIGEVTDGQLGLDATAKAVTAAVMLCCVGATCALMLLAGPIHRVTGPGGASIVSRVMGIILAAVAVDGVLGAISDYFGLS